jgi:hypothetical protein
VPQHSHLLHKLRLTLQVLLPRLLTQLLPLLQGHGQHSLNS